MQKEHLSLSKKRLFYSIIFLILISAFIGGFLFYDNLVGEKRNQVLLYSPMFQKREAPFRYSLIPGWMGVDHTVPVQINSAGVRGDEWQQPPEGDLRVLALGDSVTFGVALAYEKTYTKILEKNLRASGVDALVFNAGVPGWNFRNQVDFLKYYWPKIRPQIVTILFVQNDLDDSLTAGQYNQLDAPKIPFKPFFRNTDAWAMESFSLAYQKNSALPLTLGNAFQESWRLPFYDSLSHYEITPFGMKKFKIFAKGLMELQSFLKEKGVSLFIGVHNTIPGNLLEKQLEKIFQEQGVPHVFLSRWTGDSENYKKYWSLLPLDNHGNAQYHSLFSGLIQNFLTTIPVGKKLKIPQYENLPQPLSKPVYQKMVDRVRKRESERVARIGDHLSLNEPETQKQLLTMGGGYAQWRAIFKPTVQSKSLEIVPAPTAGFSRNDTSALWLQVNGFTGFVPATWDGDRIRASLPTPLKKGELVEIGLVMGTTEKGVFTERYPLQSIRLLGTSLETESLQKDMPLIIRGEIQGLFADSWISDRLQFVLHNGWTKGRGDKEIIRLVIDGRVPKIQYPIRLTAATGEGGHLGELVILAPKEYNWDIVLRSEGISKDEETIQIKCDRLFIPSQLDSKNADNRKLCVRLLKIEVH